jgi:glucan phosphoethanolaminetransferase (alkaline phosphatase superfamily)
MWLMVWFTAGFTAQLYRYRQVSTPMEQQQTKWVVSGFAAMLVILALAGVLLQVVPWLKQPGAGVLFYTLLVVPVAACGLTLLPLSFGFAILHSRLWDIDILINRTLVYSTLTVLLASIYALSVVLLQTVLRTLTNQTSPLTVVVSTLAVAVLFQPLRRRIQAIIDRRFYRRKYDAQKTVQGFSARLREETDFAHLSNDLIAVIQETLQPAHVSLWLRDGGVRSAEQRSATRASREVS